MVNINNYESAFRYKSTGDLRFAYFIFSLMRYPALVKWLTGIAETVVRKGYPGKGIVRKTIFNHFCSGENEAEAFSTIENLRKFGVEPVLDYVAESENSDGSFWRNKNIIISNIRRLKDVPGSAVSVKISGLESVEFLKRVNPLHTRLSIDDEHRYSMLESGLRDICAEAARCGVTVYIDAEERCTQDLFDRLAEVMMRDFNGQKAVVYNTLQMYLIDRPAYLHYLLDRARRERFYPGVKLVRGAYVELERKQSAAEGVASPVHATKEDTDAAFNAAMTLCLKNHDFVYTCVATHNSYSILFALKLLGEFGVDKSKIGFSQLYGMCDNLTFNLAHEGFHASKYLPYGEVEKAIPYLIRRAEENASITGQAHNEVRGIRLELRRRRKKGVKKLPV